jgi:hypothetical protein
MLAVVALAAGLAAPAARAQQAHIEKIPLLHIDVRTVAALLGAPVLPNELEVAQQRSVGAGSAPGYGYASAYPQAANARAPWFAQGNAPVYAPQPGLMADPRTNSLIFGR